MAKYNLSPAIKLSDQTAQVKAILSSSLDPASPLSEDVISSMLSTMGVSIDPATLSQILDALVKDKTLIKKD